MCKVQISAPENIRSYELVPEAGETKARYRARKQLLAKILEKGGY